MHISALTIYPVKSLQGVQLLEAEVTPFGLKWDRFWMIVNEDGLFMSQRNLSQMATIKTAITDTHLILSHPTQADLQVPLNYSGNLERQVKVWRSECEAVDEGKQASEWLTEVLGTHRGQQLRLVRMAENFDREVSQNHTNELHHTYFADGYPFLVVSQSSLTALNNKLTEQQHQLVPMNRFRGNIELTGAEAFAEHQYDYLSIDEQLVFHLCKPCERCKVITQDQFSGETLEKQQPLKTLFAMDHVPEKGAFFGHNAVIHGAQQTPPSRTLKVGANCQFKG